jgi:hypothetical protein
MDSYSKAAVERAMKVQEVILPGNGEEDYVVSGGRDHRHQRPAHAALAGALRGGRPSPKRVPVAVVERVLELYHGLREGFFWRSKSRALCRWSFLRFC